MSGTPLTAFLHEAGFASVSTDGMLSLWDVASSSLTQQHPRPTHLAVRWTCIAAHAQDERTGLLALGSDSGVVVVWDLALGRIVHELSGHTQSVHAVAFEGSGRTLLSCGSDRQILTWSLDRGEILHSFATGTAAVNRMVPTSAAEHLLLGSTGIRLVRRDTWKRLGKVPGHAGKVTCLCLSPDDRLAASSGNDRHLSLWRVAPSAMAEEGWEPCVQTLALETTVVQVSFDCSSQAANGGLSTDYSLLALTSAGVLSVWRIEAASVFPTKGMHMHARMPQRFRRKDPCARHVHVCPR